MKAAVTASIAILATVTLAYATDKKDIEKQIVRTSDEITKNCGCTVTFSYSRDIDFTTKAGSSLALNIKSVVSDVGTRAGQWCKKGDDFREKLCLMVKSVEIDQDPSTKRPYTTAVARGVVRSYIASGNPNQISNHGGAWLEPFLQSGRMPERKPE